MATFECKVYELTIEEHPNADVIELALVGDYYSIVRKGQFKTGDLGVYIPEAAIVPEWLLKSIGLEDKLAGKKKNRVKAIKLRGILSQGIIVPLVEYPFNTLIDEVGYDAKGMVVGVKNNEQLVKFAPEGTDVTEFLGIIKYEPPIPTCMNGEVFNAFGDTIKYDIENFKRYPDVLQEGEEVYITEKLHGTWCCMGYHPEVDVPIVTSKGLSEKGLAFKFNEANVNNLYVRAFEATKDKDGKSIVDHAIEYFFVDDPIFYILGEIYGKGIQDAAFVYDAEKPKFRVFDVYYGQPGQGEYLGYYDLVAFCERLNLEMVPVIYVGPFSKEKMLELTDGKTLLGGKNIREGTVTVPLEERRDPEVGRVILKSVSEVYILRKNGTEYN